MIKNSDKLHCDLNAIANYVRDIQELLSADVPITGFARDRALLKTGYIRDAIKSALHTVNGLD